MATRSETPSTGARTRGGRPPSRTRTLALDGLRAVLVSAVLAYHLTGGRLPVATGEVAVVVFFALSGYLITRLLVRERRATGTVDLAAFYLNRARRLLPPLALLLGVWLAVALLWSGSAWLTSVPGGGPGHPVGTWTALETVAAAATYVTNWLDALPHLHLWVGYSPLGHLWTLAVEEQFYLLWAPIVLVLARFRRSAPVVLLVGLAFLAEPFALAHAPFDRVYFGTDARTGALLLGAAAGWWRAEHPAARRAASTTRAARAWGGAAAAVTACLVVAGVGEAHPGERTWWVAATALASLAGASLVVVVAEERGRLASALAHPVLVWLGRRSYAAYLWGYVFNTWFRSLGLATAPLVVVCTLVAAELSYRTVEVPYRRRRQARVASGPRPEPSGVDLRAGERALVPAP